jgi:hypothetical protein
VVLRAAGRRQRGRLVQRQGRQQQRPLVDLRQRGVMCAVVV